MHIFLVDPLADNIELRSRSKTEDFDGLHKQFLHYKDFKEGKYPELFYDEPGIAMSFSALVPDVILKTHPYDSDTPGFLQQTYEIVYPEKHASTDAYIKLFHTPCNELYSDNPIPFNEIPELASILPEMSSALPFVSIEAGSDGKYSYDQWKPMISHDSGTWL